MAVFCEVCYWRYVCYAEEIEEAEREGDCSFYIFEDYIGDN